MSETQLCLLHIEECLAKEVEGNVLCIWFPKLYVPDYEAYPFGYGYYIDEDWDQSEMLSKSTAVISGF